MRLNRDEHRKIKSMNKDQMEYYLTRRDSMVYEGLRRKFEEEYQDEVNNTINNFFIAIGYTLTFNENIHLEPGDAHGVMEDLLATVDMFRTGEYKPKDYIEEMHKYGIIFEPYDYTKVFREKEGKYQKRNEQAISWIENWISHGDTKCNLGDLQLLQNLLKGDETE